MSNNERKITQESFLTPDNPDSNAETKEAEPMSLAKISKTKVPLERGFTDKTSTAGSLEFVLPTRWEIAKRTAEERQALPALLNQIRTVSAFDHLNKLIQLSADEGHAWVVYGASGSGKSAFFHTLEHQTEGRVKTKILDGNDINLTNQNLFAERLVNTIRDHKARTVQDTPLLIVLEERETNMAAEERSAICQALRNVLRSEDGKGVIFVLPVTDRSQAGLFVEQARNTGIGVSTDSNIYFFEGPRYTEHVDILTSLFTVLNDRDISEYGLSRSDLQQYVSSSQTIGEYIRQVRNQLSEKSASFRNVLQTHSYKKLTVIMCFVNPIHTYRSEPIIRALSINRANRIRTGELTKSHSNNAQMWKNKHVALANVVETLDIRIVEIAPEIVVKVVYAYGTPDLQQELNLYLEDQKIPFNPPKSVRQNLRQQLEKSNLFRIIANEEVKDPQTPRYVDTDAQELSEEERLRKEADRAELIITEWVCKKSQNNQNLLHDMFAKALQELLNNAQQYPSIADFKAIHYESDLTISGRKVLRPDIVIEMQDKLFLLEFCWRSVHHFSYNDVTSYVLRKIKESYSNLPLVKALSEA